MPYKDRERAKAATRERVRRYREKNVTPSQNVTPTPVTPDRDVTPDVTPKASHPGVPKDVIVFSPQTFGYATRDVPTPAWLKPETKGQGQTK